MLLYVIVICECEYLFVIENLIMVGVDVNLRDEFFKNIVNVSRWEKVIKCCWNVDKNGDWF